MNMNGYERNLVNKWQRSMSRREAEERLYELREEQNGDMYAQLRPERVRYAPGAKQEAKRQRIKAEIDRQAKSQPVDPEHPVLRKYIPEFCGTDASGLSKAAYQTMKREIAETYGIPLYILDISNLEACETKIADFKEKISRPNRAAYDLLCRKKTRLDGLKKLLGGELYGLFCEPYSLVDYAKERQEDALAAR